MEIISSFKALADDKRFIQDVREIILNERLQEKTEDFFQLVPGIKGGKQVAAMRGLEYITTKSKGCGGKGISPDFPAFSQLWNPQLQEVKINYCYADFENSYLKWALNNGYDRKNLTGTELGLFIEDLVAEAMSLDMLRIVLMADKDIETQDILTNEAEKAQFYNTIDKGLIPTLQYLKTLPEFQDNFIQLSKNTGTTIEQQELEKDYSVNIYEDVTDTLDFDGDYVLSSNSLAKNYSKWLKRGNGYSIESNKNDTVKGIQNLEVDGYGIKAVKNYDRWRKTDFQTGEPLTTHLPHFALFTKKEFLQVGIDDAASLQDITLEYIGGEDETFWIKANYMLDFKLTNPYAIKAAI
ncbi:hypothetical protein HX096_12050 [Empedobacter falsenii]|uniref:hypothetical protein n=1 Tax=Empedobacter falsenii TaxID=343874 RepID=UPI00257728E0|nr:hypothetical protein [Empedobacter falsenii]MDM1548585.1 hypothetical protein [Empedobacter falsenii]